MLKMIRRVRLPLLLLAAALVAAAVSLPLWGMTLVSTQYPEGLRMIVYPGRIVGDIAELNALNRYVGMMPISDEFFAELRILPTAFYLIAAAAVGAALVRRRWSAAVPLVLMSALAAYGFRAMHTRLWQFGHDLDPSAPIEIPPFTPPMFGTNQIAQFASYSYFSWGTFLPLAAGVLIALVLASDYTAGRRPADVPRAVPA
jgi:copper chaperone NosL